jgi:predicted DNA-binding protein
MCDKCAGISTMKRTNFFFSEEMLARLKAAKLDSGIPVSEIIHRAVESYLKSMGH